MQDQELQQWIQLASKGLRGSMTDKGKWLAKCFFQEHPTCSREDYERAAVLSASRYHNPRSYTAHLLGWEYGFHYAPQTWKRNNREGYRQQEVRA